MKNFLVKRIVEVLDQSLNKGKPLDEYTFWPDVHEGLRTMYLRTHFAVDEGGFFPAVKVSYTTLWQKL